MTAEEMKNLLSVKWAAIEGYEILTPPKRGTEFSAGTDIFLPKFNEVFRNRFNEVNTLLKLSENTVKSIHVMPLYRVLLPTGITLRIPNNTYVNVATKSGKFSKKGLKVGSHVIDSDYQGEIFISLFNTTGEPVSIDEGEVVAQLIHSPVFMFPWSELPEDIIHEKQTERGDKGFGSTHG